MKTKLVLAMCAALLASGVAMAAQTDQSGGDAVQTTKTVTTTTHLNGANTTWYKEGGIVPVEYRGNTYVVQKWQVKHLNAPTEGSHWVRGDNGDYLLVNENTGAITSIIHQPD